MSSPKIRPGVTILAGAMAAILAAPAAQAAAYVTRSVDLGSPATPTAVPFSNAFIDADPLTADLQLTGIGTLASTDTFYDDYAFSVSDTSFSAFSATLDLGSLLQISNLQLRLYRGTLASASTGAIAPDDLLVRWTNSDLTAQGSASAQGGSIVQLIAPMVLDAGSYVLEVRGNITGAAGGSYAGVFNLGPVAAVPEPGPLTLALAGLGVLGFVARRRR